jgi:hypothetical protein
MPDLPEPQNVQSEQTRRSADSVMQRSGRRFFDVDVTCDLLRAQALLCR